MFRDHTKRMTAAEYAAFAGRELPNTADTSNPPFALPPDAKTARFALGRLKTGEMNKTEAAYAAHLDRIKGTVIAWYRFEGVKLRLADNTFYSPDFAVMLADGTMEMHEVKGFWQDDARVKIKVAASLYPFRFLAMKPRAKKHGGGWEVEEF
jgi:hypothetical protein